jgi:ribosomal protein L31E
MARKKIMKVRHKRRSERAVKEIEEIKSKRFKSGLDKELSWDSEIDEMMINTPSWPKVRKELETIPKSEDIIR